MSLQLLCYMFSFSFLIRNSIALHVLRHKIYYLPLIMIYIKAYWLKEPIKILVDLHNNHILFLFCFCFWFCLRGEEEGNFIICKYKFYVRLEFQCLEKLERPGIEMMFRSYQYYITHYYYFQNRLLFKYFTSSITLSRCCGGSKMDTIITNYFPSLSNCFNI